MSAASAIPGSRPRARGSARARPTRPARNPLPVLVREVRDLHRVAREGRSAATPLILVGTWVVVLVPLVSLVVAIALLVAHLVAR